MAVSSFLPDTSCVVAAALGSHADHEATMAELERRLRARERMVVCCTVLVEAYSVLTRLPVPHRLAPAAAIAILRQSFLAGIRPVALTSTRYVELLGRLSEDGIEGGLVYDGVIAATAVQARVRTILTWNVRHFERLGFPGITVVAPRRE